ncbi:MAG: HEAT repeat domain-containing protein, partial [Planctomycetota bacterium]|nr:HEAT repeat domain-containing protein [Planctomycetota bacterium]
IQKSVDRAVAWATTNFRLPPSQLWRMYFLYGVERMAALGNLTALGPHDWYAEGAAWLLKEQQPNGAWTDNGGEVIATAFSILFLSKSTAKMLGRSYDVAELGGGLLAGGRGLPDDLGRVKVTGVEKREAGCPLDELLGRLESVSGADVPDVQNAVLEAIRFGDREKLIGQRERLRRLVLDPRPEVRRTALWALGRGGELSDVPLLIRGLSDEDAAVEIEAHNALCVLSRRPLAFGLSGDPLGSLPEDASDAQKAQTLAAWRQEAVAAWTEWYRRVAPYDERDGLGLFR